MRSAKPQPPLRLRPQTRYATCWHPGDERASNAAPVKLHTESTVRMNTSTASSQPSPNGRRLPDLTLKAAGSGRELRLAHLKRPAVLICHTRDNASAAGQIVIDLRDHYPDSDRVLVANVADLRGVPKFVNGLVYGIMAQAYRDSVKLIPAHLDPAQYVVILPDWGGAVLRAAGFRRVDQHPGIVIAAPDGRIHSAYQGADPGGHILAALRDLID